MQLTAPDAPLRQHLLDLPHWQGMTRLGVAVSGGSDSTALLHLLAACAAERGVALEGATVDHGLRPEAADEARDVAKACAGLGVRHEILRWEGWDRSGNLQAEARAARYRLLGAWAQERRLDAVALAHTRDDQAETFLMRLGREAGVDGLAAMADTFTRAGVTFWRPALALARADLRAFLTRHGIGWCEDPSNEDAAYDRVRARRALAVLDDLGLGVVELAGVAENLADARRALERCTHDLAKRCARVEAGDVILDRVALRAADPELARRLMVSVLTWVSVADYAPRRSAVAAMMEAVAAGRGHTLHGCQIMVDREKVRISREYAVASRETEKVGALWDGRWMVTGPDEVCEVRALGAAITDCPDWRETGLPRASLMASPAVWRGDALIAAPVAGLENGYSATINHPNGDFFTSILTH